MAINVTIYKTLPYDPAADFVPLALAAQTAVRAGRQSGAAGALGRRADRLRQGEARAALLRSAGPGAPHHLYRRTAQEHDRHRDDARALRGSLPALNDVVAGHMPLTFVDLGPALGMIQAGKVRALGISTKARLPRLPDIPPIGDTACRASTRRPGRCWWRPPRRRGRSSTSCTASSGRAGTAGDQGPDRQRRDAADGQPSVEGLQDFVKSEIVRWGEVVRQAGLAGIVISNSIRRAHQFAAEPDTDYRSHFSGTKILTTSMSCGRSPDRSCIPRSAVLASRPFSSR